jgi:hypothetical protein
LEGLYLARRFALAEFVGALIFIGHFGNQIDVREVMWTQMACLTPAPCEQQPFVPTELLLIFNESLALVHAGPLACISRSTLNSCHRFLHVCSSHAPYFAFPRFRERLKHR